ncbi:MAG: hypothetical protein ABL971_08490 [Vicinamibacterales bacterium]
MIEEAFSPLDPEHAQHSLPVARFVEFAAPLKPRFIHHPRTQALLLALLADLAVDLEGTYFDVPRMRIATSELVCLSPPLLERAGSQLVE